MNRNFRKRDLRGVDFSGADLRGADFSEAITGLSPHWKWGVFLLSLFLSIFFGALSGWSGNSIQGMIDSGNPRIARAGYFITVETAIFLCVVLLGGFRKAIHFVTLPAITLAFALGVIAAILHQGNGVGSLMAIIGIILAFAVVLVGTLARTAAGNLSSLLFIVVALSGAIAAKSAGGGILVTLVALSCVVVSKRALAGSWSFSTLNRWIVNFLLSKGTRFKGADLSYASFRNAKLAQSDFLGANLEGVLWEGASGLDLCRFDKGVMPQKHHQAA